MARRSPFTRAQRDSIVAVAKATVEKTVRETPAMTMSPGTVVSYARGSLTATPRALVILDGPPMEDGAPADPIPCPVLLPIPLDAGDRVFVTYNPPHAHYVTGTINQEVCPIFGAWAGTTSTNDGEITPVVFSEEIISTGHFEMTVSGLLCRVTGLYVIDARVVFTEVSDPELRLGVRTGLFRREGADITTYKLDGQQLTEHTYLDWSSVRPHQFYRGDLLELYTEQTSGEILDLAAELSIRGVCGEIPVPEYYA